MSGRLIVGCPALAIVLILTACGPGAIAQQDVDAARDRLRPTVTDAERDDFIEDCLRDQGSAAFTRNPEGGFGGTEVRDSDIEAMDTCVALSFDRWPNPPPPQTREEYAALYDLYLLVAKCLQEQDVDVEVPSLDTYIDQAGAWTPYVAMEAPPERIAELQQQCPQDPWLYENEDMSTTTTTDPPIDEK